ncbi:MAG: ATP-binding cassette domain-containing protein [Paraclostridium sordellii]
MNCISTKNLNISYGNLDIVKDLNLEIPKGKITTIIGSNGCGKSTILKTIARIIKPKSGDIYVNDKNIKEAKSKGFSKNDGCFASKSSSTKWANSRRINCLW